MPNDAAGTVTMAPGFVARTTRGERSLASYRGR